MYDKARFFLKKSPSGKNDQKWLKMAQKQGFGLFKKITSLVLSIICVKWKFLWLLTFCKNRMLGKIWFSSYSQKWLLANEISVFFNCQYFTNRLISDFDFWHVDRHEWKEQSLLTGFLRKLSFGKMGHFGSKNPLKCGSAVRIVLKFCSMTGANR